MNQTRGIKEIANTMSPVIQAIKTAISALRTHPEIFDESLDSAKAAMGLISGGSKEISEGVKDLIVSTHLMQEAVVALFHDDTRGVSAPIAENFITDLDTAQQFVSQSLDQERLFLKLIEIETALQDVHDG